MDGAAVAGVLAAAASAAGFCAVVPRRDRVTPAAEVIGGYAENREAPARPRKAAQWPLALALRLSRPGIRASLQRRLDAAGNPPGRTPDRVLAAKTMAMLALGCFCSVYGLRDHALLLPAIAAGAVTGFFVPDLLLCNAGIRRRAAIAEALPDAVDLLTICVEAGLALDAALRQVADGIGGPLGAAVSRALADTGLGKGRSRALRDMAERANVPELRTFIAVLVQAGEIGIPVAGVLREQSARMRQYRRERAEEKAQKVAVKILFPLLFCLFPALFIFVLGPGALQILQTLTGR